MGQYVEPVFAMRLIEDHPEHSGYLLKASQRREEIAALSEMSVDYYSRIEQQRWPHPSEQMIAALARGLRLSLGERDHLFRLSGYSST